MIPELGHLALIIALCLALCLAMLPLWGSWRNHYRAMSMAPSLALGMCVFTALSFTALALAFVGDDFSVALVANHSNRLLPAAFKFSAVWGNHEGSLLLWVLVLSLWTSAVALFSTQLPLPVLARVLSVLGFIAVGFLLFSLFTSNPFLRTLPAIPTDGSDLNPLLQDIGLVIHPPVLYMGYVGFSVAFAFAIAALIGGRLDASWARWSRPWTNTAWAFLSLGIMLGSWWAYYELGWGGWWFWDPVENASFMPWLAGTALVHSLAVTEKRGLFKSWTLLLAILTFSLSLLGTFLVRSGVLTSVHSFASDPARGVYILLFLALVVGGSLTLYALRAPALRSRISFAAWSRESLVLFNNLVFLVATLTVLFGTLFPLLMDALGQGKYSVGPPYFNAVFLPLMAVAIPMMGLAPFSRWKQDSEKRWRRELLLPLVAALVAGALFPSLYRGSFNPAATLAMVLSSWLLLSMLKDFLVRTRNARGFIIGLRRQPLGYYAMMCAHLGFAVCVLGVVLTSQYAVEKDLKMSPGEQFELAGYRFQFDEFTVLQGPNYVAEEGRFSVHREGRAPLKLSPQKRRYLASGQTMTEAAIDAGIFRDIFIALGEPIGEQAWAVRLHYKPFIRWIWGGAILIAFGGFLSVGDRRYRRAVRQGAPAGVLVEHGPA